MMLNDKDRRLAAWIATLLLVFYLISYSGLLHSIDELSSLAVAESLIAGEGWHTNQLEWERSWSPSQSAVGHDGNLYSKKGIAVSLLTLPLLAVGKAWNAVGAVQVALLITPLFLAFAALLFFLAIRKMDYSIGTCAIVVLSWGLTTPTWPYAKTLFSEPLTAAVLIVSLYGAISFRRAVTPGANLRYAAITGTGLSLAIMLKQANSLLVIPFMLYGVSIVAREKLPVFRWRAIIRWALIFVITTSIGVGVTLIYNAERFGTPWSPPLEPAERFTTPLHIGLIGLLISPGKGLLWYTPLTWLLLLALPEWRRQNRLPDLLLALGSFVTLLFLYAGWFDWPGGRAWGPRFLVAVLPALVLMISPALSRLFQKRSTKVERLFIATVLLLSLFAQLPGVLIDFDRQEGLEVQAGITVAQRLWSWNYSPLVTYWSALRTTTRDPLLSHHFVWSRVEGWIAAGLLVAAFLLAIRGASLTSRDKPMSKWSLHLQMILLVSAMVALVIAARSDPRWHETSADPAENQVAFSFLHKNATRNDVVLLDFIPYYDMMGRAREWMNSAPFPPAYIGWMRKTQMHSAQGEQLATWLSRYHRVWLVLQGTQERSPDSTTEHWLDTWAYSGRREWLGTQRVIEYILPDGETPSPAPAVYTFGDRGPRLSAYAVRLHKEGTEFLVDLHWTSLGEEEARFSLQALDDNGRLLAQVDRRPGGVTIEESMIDRVALAAPADVAVLILRAYSALTGEIWPAIPADGGATADSLILARNPH